MKKQHTRTAMLLGQEACAAFSGCRVAVFGIGGVGGYVAEALARSGVGTIDLIDNDTVSESNINRQIIALHSTVGMPKVEVMAERIHDIDPDIKVNCHNIFYLPETSNVLNFAEFDYIADAIDTVSGKLSIVMHAAEAGVPVISSMGTGNKTDPTAFRVTDIFKTSVCPLAKTMRTELRKRGIKHLKVVFSDEVPKKPEFTPVGEINAASPRRSIPGSCAFVPPAAGLAMAGEIIKDLASAKLKTI